MALFRESFNSMRGEFIDVWSETWRSIWSPLERHRNAPSDLFSELYREFALSLTTVPTTEELADVVGEPAKARVIFRRTKLAALRGERAVVQFLERAHIVLTDLGGDALANRYFRYLEAFVTKFNLRYDLRRSCTLHPTLTGMFGSLIRKLKELAQRDAHLHPLMLEFEEAVRDLSSDLSTGRIKTCIQKHVNLLEAIGRQCPTVKSTTLGRICDEVAYWPHSKVKEAAKNLYGFASDYPGIRHGGTPANAIRDIELRDLVAVSVMLTGCSSYLTDQLDYGVVYQGD
jgi:hypothetical protein